MSAARPPRLARALLARVVPADLRDYVPDEYDELFSRRAAAVGRVRASFWYWRQLGAFLIHLNSERLRRPRFSMNSGFSLIDLKLALRMLVRYPGLTLVCVFGMAVGIGIAAATFTIADRFIDPSLPLPGGDRLVSIQLWDVRTNNREPRSAYDFTTWRDELTSVEDLGAFRMPTRNLIVPGATPEMVTLAQISAAGFRVAGVAPALGRALLPEDERPGAPDVVVLSDTAWRRKFAADPNILGRPLQLGGTVHAVVGVMPPGFAFPVNNTYWIPLRLDPVHTPLEGPAMNVFARLAAGATIEVAQAELSAIGQRVSSASPRTHEHLRPRVMPYAYAFTDMDDPDSTLVMRVLQSTVVVMLAIVCINVAILVYARTATRQGEIAVRTALGASRRRIVAQLFTEALVLAGVAAGLGLAMIDVAFTQLEGSLGQMMGTLPFWMRLSLSFQGVLFVVGFALLAAAIVGVVPALKATGRRVHTRLQGLSAGSGGRMQMGRVWTFLIVAQVATAVALLPMTVCQSWDALMFRAGDPGYRTHEYLTAGLLMDGADGGSREESKERYGLRQAELERMLEADAQVAAVTFGQSEPGGELAAVLEVEGLPAPSTPVNYNIVEGSKDGRLVRFNKIAPDFFAAFDVPVLMGRGLRRQDASPGAAPIVVNRRFVERVLGGESALGRRVRYVGRSREAGAGNVELNRWYEIVGVVADFPKYATSDADDSSPRLYHAVLPGDLATTWVAVRVRGNDAGAFAARLREIAAAVDPRLQLQNLMSGDDAIRREQGLFRLIGLTLLAITLSVVFLAAAGIYALMSFTVARRRKEIGIRTALGADPRRILAGVFRRAFGQLAGGAVLGMLLAIALEQLSGGDMLAGQSGVVIPLVAVLMMIVGLAAAYGPARQGLRIQPTEALREE